MSYPWRKQKHRAGFNAPHGDISETIVSFPGTSKYCLQNFSLQDILNGYGVVGSSLTCSTAAEGPSSKAASYFYFLLVFISDIGYLGYILAYLISDIKYYFKVF